MSLLLDDLQRELGQGRVALVVSSNLTSRLTGGAQTASWQGMLLEGLSRCPGDEKWRGRQRAALGEGELAEKRSAASQICKKLGAPMNGEYGAWLRGSLESLKLAEDARALIKLLQGLDVVLLTTGVDSLLSKELGVPAISWLDQSDIERLLRNEGRAVLHLFGHSSDLGSVVLGDNEEHERSLRSLLPLLTMNFTLVLVQLDDGPDDPSFDHLVTLLCEHQRSPARKESEYRQYWLGSAAKYDQHRTQLEEARIQFLPGAETLVNLVDLLASIRPLNDDGSPRLAPPTYMVQLDLYSEEVYRNLTAEDEAIFAHLKAYRYQDALALAERAVARTEGLAKRNPADLALRKQLTTLRLREASARFNLQDIAAARALLTQVFEHPMDLTPASREGLANMLIQSGDVDRARALVPHLQDDPSRAARIQLDLALAEGEIPEEEPEDAVRCLRVGYLLLEKGRCWDAAVWGRRALDKDPDFPLLLGNALYLLLHALHKTVHEDPPFHQPIPLAERAAVLERVEGLFVRLDTGDLASRVTPALRRDLQNWGVLLSLLTRDVTQLERYRAALPLQEQETPPLPDRDALAGIPATTPEWRGHLAHAQALDAAGRNEEALATLRAALERWPRRMPLGYPAAKLLLKTGQSAEALAVAEWVFDELPGLGQRLLLAQCLISVTFYPRAWALLQPVRGSEDLHVLELCILAADQAAPDELIALLLRYLQQRPQELRAQSHLLLAYHRLGQTHEAKERAWALFEGPLREQFDPHLLWTCASFQFAEGPLESKEAERVIKIALHLRAKFPTDPQALTHYLDLKHKLGHPPSLPAADLKLLVQAGFLKPITEEVGLATLSQQLAVGAAAEQCYQQGLLSFEGLSALASISAAQYLASVLEQSPKGQIFFAVPAGSTLRALPNGAQLLVTELDLLLLMRLGLLELLREQLGPGGKVLLFADVEQEIQLGPLPDPFGRAPAPAELERLQRLQRLLERHPRVHREPGPLDLSDHLAAPQQGFIAIEPERLNQADPPAKVFLAVEHVLDRRWEDLLETTLNDGAVDLWYGPQAMAAIDREISAQRVSQHAHELARRLQEQTAVGLREGWIEVIARPDTSSLIPALQQPHGLAQALGRDPLCRALAYHVALQEDPQRFLLTADFFTADPLSAALATTRPLLLWTEEALQGLLQRTAAVESRIWDFGALARALPDPLGRESRRKLAELGHSHALTAEDLLDLAAKPGGLRGPVAERLLQRMEWMAREVQHPMAAAARLQLARLYGEVVWRTFVKRPKDSWAEELGLQLLDRVAPLGMTALDAAFLMLALLSIGDLLPPRLWFWLDSKIDDRPSWLPSYRRALRQALIVLNQHVGERGFARAHWLCRSTRQDQRYLPLGGLDLCRWDIEARLILSALWEDQQKLSLQVKPANEEEPLLLVDLLQQAVSLVVAPQGEKLDALADLRWAFPARTKSGRPIHVLVPPESILLRLPSEKRPDYAWVLAHQQGPHDGRSYELLKQLAAQPSDQALAQRYIEQTLLAPWRLLREDVTTLLRWPELPRRYVADIDDLRRMLSEAGPLPEGSLAVHLQDHPWFQRVDRDDLFRGLTIVPGEPMLLSALDHRLKESRLPEEVMSALADLQEPESHPAAQLASDVFLLRAAAGRCATVQIDGDTINLHERLPEHFASLLRSLLKPQVERSPDTLAFAEGALLRVCAGVVEGLAAPGGVSLRDGLFLTHRLFGWLVLQLRALSPDARRSAILTLSAQAPPPNPREHCVDLLNPFRFAPSRYDHRLAFVLYALASVDPMLRAVSSRDLEAQLLRGAAAPFTEDELELRRQGGAMTQLWWQLPGTVPELALSAALSLDSEALLRLSSEQRQRWLGLLPVPEEHSSNVQWHLMSVLLWAIAAEAARLSDEECALVQERLRALRLRPDLAPEVARLCWTCEVAMLERAGSVAGADTDRLEQQIRAHFQLHHQDQDAPEVFGRFLVALARRRPAQLQDEVDQLLRLFPEGQGDPMPFLRGLVRVLTAEVPSLAKRSAQACLRRLAQTPRFAQNEQMQSLLASLGLEAS